MFSESESFLLKLSVRSLIDANLASFHPSSSLLQTSYSNFPLTRYPQRQNREVAIAETDVLSTLYTKETRSNWVSFGWNILEQN